MKKKLIIIFAVILTVLLFAFALWRMAAPKKEEKNEPVVPIDKKSEDTTTIYGVEMRNKCYGQFQDFIKTYGSDYSKCLVSFDFSEESCGGFDPDTQGLSDVNIVVILDSSGSMAEKIGSEAKIDIAKKAVSDFLIKMPKGVKTGLVVYGHRGSNSTTDKDLSCKGVQEVVKLGSNNSGNIISAMDSFGPRGWTPIAGSLDFAKSIFTEGGKNNKNYLVLVSDGAESCDGDPLLAAEDLKIAVPGIKLIVIGFATDKTTKDFLTKIAVRGGGSYVPADNSAGIATAFNNQLAVIKKECLRMTLLKASFMYKNNSLSNLNCWLTAYEKEANNFTENILNKPINPDCNMEMADALRGRHTEAWYDKQAVEEKNSASYKKIEADFNNQLKILESAKK